MFTCIGNMTPTRWGRSAVGVRCLSLYSRGGSLGERARYGLYVVAPGSIPTAHNGKVQRLIAREMHDQGAFARNGSGSVSVSEPSAAREV